LRSNLKVKKNGRGEIEKTITKVKKIAIKRMRIKLIKKNKLK
jgi:hypothetical protein